MNDLYVSFATHIYVASLCFSNGMLRSLGRKLVMEAHKLRCIATLRKCSLEFDQHLCARVSSDGPVKKYIEMSWTKRMG